MNEQDYIDNIDEYRYKHFGNWKVLGAVSKRNRYNQAQYKCKCLLCGKIRYLAAKFVIDTTSDKHPISCGCVSRGVYVIRTLLQKSNIPYQTEVSIQDLRSPKGALLRFDFVLTVNYNGLWYYYGVIEYDGKQHTDIRAFRKITKTRSVTKTNEKFKYYQECDKIKEDYCKKKGLHFLRIPYSNDMQKIQEQLVEYLTDIGYSNLVTTDF